MTERSEKFTAVYHYLSNVKDVEELPVELPGVESVTVMSGTTPAPERSPFKAVRLKYKRLPKKDAFMEEDSSEVPDTVGPRALYCFDEAGNEDMMFMNNGLLGLTDRLPEAGERITPQSLGFFITVLNTLHIQYPALFSDPTPLVEKIIPPNNMRPV